MLRNYLKGIAGDLNNALLAAIGYNLKKKLNQIKDSIAFLFDLLSLDIVDCYKTQNHKSNF